MTTNSTDLSRLARLRAMAACVLVASLAACGGGGSGNGGTPPPPPPPPPPAASRCIDPTPAATSTVRFATPVAPAASTVEVSNNGLSACFLGAAAAGVKSDVAAPHGVSSFYYFEATRSQLAAVSMGISASAGTAPPVGGFVPQRDTLLISGEDMQTVDAAGATRTAHAGPGLVFGFAVDLRAAHPVVSVIAPASTRPGACSAALAADAPCVIQRWEFQSPAAALSIYAFGSGDGNDGPRVSINTGSDQLAKPYTYATAGVLAALRAARPQGDRAFDAQWPAAGGPASVPTLAPVGGDRAVLRKGDTAWLPTTLRVTPTHAAAGIIAWKDETGAARGSGASLPVDAALVGALAVGEHVLTASVVNPQTGRYGQTSFRVLVLAAGVNGDDDGDGLTYSQELAAGLNPGNADSDGDGLADGAESGLGANPLAADNSADAALPRRGMLVREAGTSPGVIVMEDGLTVIYAFDLNPACLQNVAPFESPIYRGSAVDAPERCRKRAIRANVAVQPGEFRYFESRRLTPTTAPPNIGQGIITAGAQIDPYCCYVDPGDPDYLLYVAPGSPAVPTAANPTPPSVGVNSVGGHASMRLVAAESNFSPGFSATNTVYYGFAVDYTGTDPKVYVVVRDGTGAMTVSDGVTAPGFGGGPAVPMLYGHPYFETEPIAAINLGLQKFHYDPALVKSALAARGATNTAMFLPGIGAHRWAAP